MTKKDPVVENVKDFLDLTGLGNTGLKSGLRIAVGVWLTATIKVGEGYKSGN